MEEEKIRLLTLQRELITFEALIYTKQIKQICFNVLQLSEVAAAITNRYLFHPSTGAFSGAIIKVSRRPLLNKSQEKHGTQCLCA
jgi:hypothetical protein